MSVWVVLAFYVGLYVGGVAALWTVARAFGLPIKWSAALLWPVAWMHEQDRFDAERDGKA